MLFVQAIVNLGSAAYVENGKHRIVDIYYSDHSEEDKERILCEFAKPDSYIRLGICTVAFPTKGEVFYCTEGKSVVKTLDEVQGVKICMRQYFHNS